MEAVRSTWTDERLDDLNRSVERGFDRVDARFAEVNERFAEVNERFGQVDARFNSLESKISNQFIALVSIQMTGFAAVIGLVVTRL